MENQQSLRDQFLNDVSHIIQENMGDENFSVSFLAKEIGLSRSMLHRKLIRLTGKSATELISELRLARARELIEDKGATISEVAYMVGFTSPSYFIKVFKKTYKVSPGELRKNAGSRNGVRDPAGSKESRFNVFVATNTVLLILVATAAALVLKELLDDLSPLSGEPERTRNMMIILFGMGISLSILLTWMYDFQSNGRLVRTRPFGRIKKAVRIATSNKWKVAGYISIGLIIALISLNQIQKGNAAKSLDEREKTIAVLPFQNDSPDRNNKDFISGMMESILDKLCKIKDLKPLSRAAVEQFRDTIIPPQELAAILKVNYLLLGSMQKYGDRIKLTLNLVDKNGRQLWSKQYDRECKLGEDCFDLQSEIARQVASELHASITPEELQVIEAIPTTNIRALGLYRQGREAYSRYMVDASNIEAVRKARTFYRLAIEEAPDYGQAYAGLARAIQDLYWEENRMNREYSETGNRVYGDSIMQLADQAISFDPNLEEAYLVRGKYYYGARDFNRALEEFNRALQIYPNYGPAYDSRADIYLYEKDDWIQALQNKLFAVDLERGDVQVKLLRELGDFYEIVGYANKAREVYRETLGITGDSASFYLDMAGPNYCEQNWTARLDCIRRSFELDPDQDRALVMLADAYRYLGDQDSARHYAYLLMEKGKLGTEAGFPDILIYQALIDDGLVVEANRVLDRLEVYLIKMFESNTGRRDVYLVGLINLYAFTNQHEKVMEYLRQIDWHSVNPLWMIIELEKLSLPETILADPEYQLILSTLKSSWQSEHERVGYWLEENGIL